MAGRLTRVFVPNAGIREYGENTQSMVREFECPEKHGPEKLSLLRSKLLGLGIEVDAIDAVRDYRDLKMDFAELKERTQPHITFKRKLRDCLRALTLNVPHFTSVCLERMSGKLLQPRLRFSPRWPTRF